MASISRVRVALTGFPGGPGVATFYSATPDLLVNDLHAFWTIVAGMMPNSVSVQVESAGDIINDATGDLTGGWSTGAVASIEAVLTGPYPAPSGAIVTWLTAAVADGVRVAGRTFLVPLVNDAFDSSGTLEATHVATLQGAAQDVVLGGNLLVWHRPRDFRPAGPGGVPKELSAHAGASFAVTGFRVPDRVAILRSRRD